MKHFDLTQFRHSTGEQRYPGLRGIPGESGDLMDRSQAEIHLRQDSFALICRPIRKSEVVDAFFEKTITRALEPELAAKQIENIPDDWVRGLRSYVKRASLIGVDVTRLGGEINPHVQRELTYLNTLILDWQANHYLPPIFLFMHQPGSQGVSWLFASDVAEHLYRSEDGTRNNLKLRRSVAILDYTDPLAQHEFAEHLELLKQLVARPEPPPLYNAVLKPYELPHPILSRAFDKMGFVPFYLRDEEYQGFALACTPPGELLAALEPFGRQLRRTLPFSRALQSQILAWLTLPSPLGPDGSRNLLGCVAAARRRGMPLGQFHAWLAALQSAGLPQDQQALIQAILEPIPPMRLESAGMKAAAASSKPSAGVPGLYPLHLSAQSLTRIPGEAAALWPSFFGGEERSLQEFIVQGVPRAGRYFSAVGDLPRAGVYEDSLDRLGPVLERILIRMRQSRYSPSQIESALRAGLLVRFVLLWSRQEGRSLQEVVAPRSSLIEFMWNENGLSLFEFQATDQGQVNRAAIPWAGLRQKVMRHLAKIASKMLRVPLEEAYIAYADIDVPPAQLWGMLLVDRLWDFCTREQFREWWSRYAVCEYINREMPDALILDVEGIDRWVPAKLA